MEEGSVYKWKKSILDLKYVSSIAFLTTSNKGLQNDMIGGIISKTSA